MIYYVCAMYCEAQPFIESLHLKKQPSRGRFQIFAGDHALCLITGTGAMNSAIALSGLLARQEPSSEDFIINTGVCAGMRSADPTGSVFLCNQITELATGRHYYPDLLFSHPFQEAGIQSAVHPIVFPDMMSDPCLTVGSYNIDWISAGAALADMEASGFWQAASAYVQPHQIAVVKTISDHPGVSASLPAPSLVRSLMQETAKQLIPWAQDVGCRLRKPEHPLTKEEVLALQDAALRLKLSSAMADSLLQSARYCSLRGDDVCCLLQEFFSEHDVCCNSKREGKAYFELLKRHLL